MTKLKQQLLELGYEDYEYYWQKARWFNDTFVITQISRNSKGEIQGSLSNLSVKSQEHIDNIQQAFKQMQKDVEELKAYGINNF